MRIRFFLIHLFLSICLAIASMAVVFGIWYPAPLHEAAGVTKIFLMMVVIDTILGPLLTLLVTKEGKKTLKMDLTVIAVLQLAALVYGLFHVFDGRPAWIAYDADRFKLVRANEIDTRELGSARPEYQTPGWLGPQYVGTTKSPDKQKRQTMMFEEVFAGVGPAQHPELYVPLNQVQKVMLEKSQALTVLYQFNDKATVEAALKAYPQANAFFPLKATGQDMSILVRKTAAAVEVLGIVALKPW